MNQEQHQFLRLLGHYPARLTAEQAAWVLNCQAHDVPVLVAARLLQTSRQSAAEQRQILRGLGTAGARQGSGLAGHGHQRVEPALAGEKRGQESAAKTGWAWT
jgi:hypothetical protein